MEEILKKMGISQSTINQMLELAPNIKDLTKEDLRSRIDILKNIGCNYIQVRNIISSNANYLDKSISDINKLINTLQEYGFSNLNLLFDGNPYILNLDDFEIINYMEQRKENGENIESIVDDMEANPYLFEEI